MILTSKIMNSYFFFNRRKLLKRVHTIGIYGDKKLTVGINDGNEHIYYCAREKKWAL